MPQMLKVSFALEIFPGSPCRYCANGEGTWYVVRAVTVEEMVVHHICHRLLKSKQLYTTLEALIGNFREGSGRLQDAKMM